MKEAEEATMTEINVGKVDSEKEIPSQGICVNTA